MGQESGFRLIGRMLGAGHGSGAIVALSSKSGLQSVPLLSFVVRLVASNRELATEGNQEMSWEGGDVQGVAFSTRSRIENGRLIVQLNGCLDMETVAQLRKFLDRLTDDLAAQIVNTFEFDVWQLYLMNSTAISCFASWVKNLKDMYPECRVRFVTNPNLVWQKRTLGSIRRVAEFIVTVE